MAGSRPLLSGFEKIILLGLLVFFGYSYFKNNGLSVVQKSEETQIIDGKTSSEKYKELQKQESGVNERYF